MERNRVRWVLYSCLLWILVYLLYGGTNSGKSFYSSFIDDKAGFPVIGYVLILFVGGSFAVLFSIHNTRKQHGYVLRRLKHSDQCQRISEIDSLESYNIGHATVQYNVLPLSSAHSLTQYYRKVFYQYFQRICGWILPPYRGDPDFNRIGFSCLFLPLVFFTIISIYRKAPWSESNFDEFVSETANCIGLAAVIALGLLLVPVARHSVIIEALGWNPAAAVQLHAWIGRFVIIAVFLHGCPHLIRWTTTLQHKLIHVVMPPPKACWSHLMNGQFQQDATIFWAKSELDNLHGSSETSVSCFELFRYWTGTVALVALFVISLSTLYPLRRRCYALFYSIHMIAGPTVLLFAILHWNRSMIYIAGGMIYYAACSIPVWIENVVHRRMNVQVNAIEAIHEENRLGEQSDIVSITFAASDQAIERYQPGQYVRLYVPSISHISHPFSVNTVVANSFGRKNSSLRVIFRTTGPFTKQLAKMITKQTHSTAISPPSLPKIYIDGFYGSRHRLEHIEQHDSIVIVAGGIGITPYLSLLHAIHQQHHCQDTTQVSTDEFKKYNSRDSIEKKICLHWVCRDNSLIQYVKREYFQPFLLFENKHSSTCSSTLKIQIIIHHTQRQRQKTNPRNDYLDIEGQDDCDSLSHSDDAIREEAINRNCSHVGVPFSPTKFETGVNHSYLSNLPIFTSFVLISFLGFLVIWYFYINIQENSGRVIDRLFGPVFILVWGTLISVAANVMSENGMIHLDQSSEGSLEFSKLTQDHEMLKTSSVITKNRSREQESMQEEGVISSTTTRNDISFQTSCNKSNVREYAVGLATNNNITMEERDGRPTVHQFINCLYGSVSPAMFACGPQSLLDDINEVVKERCVARCRNSCIQQQQHTLHTPQHHPNNDVPSIALYLETFEM